MSGDTVTFYGTGAGAMTPAAADGSIPQSPHSAIANSLHIGEAASEPNLVTCAKAYSGDAPGLVEGIFQYNCQITVVPSNLFLVQILVAKGPTYTSPQIYAWYVK
jgi:uncharacterized protein (TIGR03437 family)